jgi:glutathione S-transferase
MAKYLLVSFKTCPWVQRAAIVLREKNVDFEFRHIEPDNRPDWFLAISPHKKVPVLRVDDRVSLFESNAIAEYLDETVLPRLHPEDAVERAVNRAWTDYVPTFAEVVTATAYADTEADYNKAAEKIPVPFERLEKAREAGQRPLLQRRQVFAGGRRLRAIPAALLLPGRGEEARPYRDISAAQGLGRGTAQAPLDALLPAGRVRGDVPREP